jgi:hypothetical protein
LGLSGSEGLVLTEVTGPGTLIIQTQPLAELVLKRLLPKDKE